MFLGSYSYAVAVRLQRSTASQSIELHGYKELLRKRRISLRIIDFYLRGFHCQKMYQFLKRAVMRPPRNGWPGEILSTSSLFVTNSFLMVGCGKVHEDPCGGTLCMENIRECLNGSYGFLTAVIRREKGSKECSRRDSKGIEATSCKEACFICV